MRFECLINGCGKTHSYEYELSYFLHVRDEHSRTYSENKEYIDAKISVLKSKDDELDYEATKKERELVAGKEAEADGWAI